MIFISKPNFKCVQFTNVYNSLKIVLWVYGFFSSSSMDCGCGIYKNLRSRWTPLIWPPMMQSILSSINCDVCSITIKWSAHRHVHSFRSVVAFFGVVGFWQPKRSIDIFFCFFFPHLLLSVLVFFATVFMRTFCSIWITMRAKNHS